MANSLFNQFGNNNNNSMSQFMSQFKRLQQTVKNPQKEVENLLQSGRMSQQQFNQLSQMANQITGRK
jgi:hypothetical protein